MSFFRNAKASLHSFTTELKQELDVVEGVIEDEIHSHTHLDKACHNLHMYTRDNRFHSFAPPRKGNDAKWFVDGCGYFWAVSVALEEAKESIWILDWWLSPELYLRRPPSQNEQYRLDRMLQAAAQRGVKVNVIVYKEVSAILTLCSEHTKTALEALHPNIAVFRHPDHILSGQVVESEIISALKHFSLKSLQLADIPEDALHALYGVNNDIVLYWAHHEKLCLIDGKIAFMGGLDMCFGRWDTNTHPSVDIHPTDVNLTVFPGQDYNNARIYDFEDVTKWKDNKLDRTKSARMGWSDLSMCLQGPVVEDLRAHFVQRWNFIYNEKYDVQRDRRYKPLTLTVQDIPDGYYHADGKNVRLAPLEKSFDTEDPDLASSQHSHLSSIASRAGTFYDKLRDGVHEGEHHFSRHGTMQGEPGFVEPTTGMGIQLVRSCSRWSNGVSTEHSIANAYIGVIRNSKHFIYIENQFFITGTSDAQHPIRNKIGAAIVDRCVQAYQNGEKFKVIVCMPSVPAFAGDLQADDSLGTRAIMEFQYSSICRGGYSIMESIEKAGVPDAKQYIRFYNLRNYDRINLGKTIAKVEQASGVQYRDARMEHDDIVGAGYDGQGYGTGAAHGQSNPQYDAYQQAASHISNDSKYDSVAACYMDGGPSIKDIPWSGTDREEMDAFVSEELYIHTKLLIADDRIVICGSANLNDRSQLGYHDSEIAVVIEDPSLVDSVMDGKPYQASRYAASLRRQLFRKHLGLLPHQDYTKPDANFMPINKDPNQYDWGSAADFLVRDPLSREFGNLWNGTATANTAIFAKAFHCVPADHIRNWKQYEEYFQRYFVSPSKKDDRQQIPPPYQYGHVVREEFPGGARELKEWLDGVRGSLVEMPLRFMDGVDFARSGLKLNALTDEVYT